MIKKIYRKGKVVIKIPVFDWSNAHLWGEYHFALAMKKQFERKNWEVLIQIYPEWNTKDDDGYDVVIVLRGIRKYIPNKRHFNIMWNISHPHYITVKEYNEYDYVFVASNIWANHISSHCDVKVESMLQCTDPELFYPQKSLKYNHELLFVGNSRNVFRNIVKDVLAINNKLAIYGSYWDKFINKKYINGIYIENKELAKAYSSCKILFNDHWKDMKEEGFISNRLFDGYGSRAFIISDNIRGHEDVFGDALVTYNTKEELSDSIKKYLKNESLRKEKAIKGYEIVIKKHTFEKRIKRIIKVIEENI
ncbi:MAG: glycosyltransferase [Anaeromicrobium sp.]|jgi:spore maturation protein CgeB|uniref:CgeB family protein n=1 Tax=Anaeromicrobium sp. TaxID=1929132 RepID=UPI0025FD71B1|nr:glycosyltransferase [Anaeromicrobium sp.]MCT4595284.1 glycosyltransferase [Anaeromicrobium sp.]